jgi:phytoene desaturase
MAEQTPIVVIGAGIGGLSAAIRLAAAGRRVIVLEQNSSVGGKMGEIHRDGFRWDTGPSVITMRAVLKDLFRIADRKLDNYLTLLPLDPITRYFYPDGTVFDATRDWPRMAEQIAKLDERDVEGYAAFLAYAARLHRITGPAFIYGSPPGLSSIKHVSPFDALQIDGLRTMDTAIRGFVRSPHMRQLLGRFATYVGASPFLAPATLNVIAHVELTGGVWYPEGGIYSIARALAKLAEELGVEIWTNAPVQEISVEHGRTVGVVRADGTRIAASDVIANVDVATVYEKLLPSTRVSVRRVHSLAQRELSCSGLVLMLGVEAKYESLIHHNIFFSSDYRREFDDIFKRAIPPEEPTIYVAITSKTDATDAPEGCENWFVLVNVPPISERFDWSTAAADYRESVLARLAEFGFDVRGRIRNEAMLTPLDLERLTGARRGALYGASSNNRWTAFRRPYNRAQDVRGLYFVGGTTHPGGGVPMVILSGKVAADMLIEDMS